MSKIRTLNTRVWHDTAICIRSHFVYDKKGDLVEEFSEPDYWLRSINSYLISRDALHSSFVELPDELFKNLFLINTLREKYCLEGEPLYTECDGGLTA